MRGWLYSGHIFTLTAARGFGLQPNAYELEQLVRDSDLRDELAWMTVAVALEFFRKHALVNGGWSVDGGASLTTYFMGACTFVFPNEFRRERVNREKRRRQTSVEERTRDVDGHHVTDPGAIAVGSIRVREDLARSSDRTRPILALTIDGYTQPEIEEMLGETSVRAIEGVLHRWRKAQQRLLRREGDQQ